TLSLHDALPISLVHAPLVVLLLHVLAHLTRALDVGGGRGLLVAAAPELGHLVAQGGVRVAAAGDHGGAQREPGQRAAHEDEADGDDAGDGHARSFRRRALGAPAARAIATAVPRRSRS